MFYFTQFTHIPVGKGYLVTSLYHSGPTYQWDNSFMRLTYIKFLLILVQFLSQVSDFRLFIDLMVAFSVNYFRFLNKNSFKYLKVHNFSSHFSFIFQFNFYLFILWFINFSFFFFRFFLFLISGSTPANANTIFDGSPFSDLRFP